MNVSIRRHGILIKSVPVGGDRARIGSGADCEIQLNDPFLSPVVAEVVKRDGSWRIVDAGTSLEGVVHDGVRVIDEPFAAGEPYLVGAFELAAEDSTPRAAAAADDDAFPMTMLESRMPEIPGTMIQQMPARKAAAPPQAAAPANKLVFSSVSSAPQQAAAPAAAQRKSSAVPRILLIALLSVAVLFLAILFVAKSGRKSPARATTATAATATHAAATTAPAPTTPANAEELAKRLELDKAFAAWDAQLAAGTAGPEVRQRVVRGSLELARAYTAANDTAAARPYFERVLRYGAAGSDEVRVAQAHLNGGA